jgi:two-component sensor histidine kinase
MHGHAELREIQQRIQSLRKTAEELKHSTGDFPALARNTARILASIKMLELNLSDFLEAGLAD